ncbi:hypothetical protein DRH29_04890 [candidate division Kazan bacterium]|uniref:Uncharacterized protein n=1 Tax=candidate division Kazan bacterium TaxID=2202143 RepID=A0A420ZBF6_UNCK3|nr:MAG: hypothetical protein DRH29_04890 [candidate division Kazan bacterium]
MKVEIDERIIQALKRACETNGLDMPEDWAETINELLREKSRRTSDPKYLTNLILEAFKLFCPYCRIKMFKVATASEVAIEELWKEKISSSDTMAFFACPKCKSLFFYSYELGYQFRRLGEITEEFAAMILTAKLGEAK